MVRVFLQQLVMLLFFFFCCSSVLNATLSLSVYERVCAAHRTYQKAQMNTFDVRAIFISECFMCNCLASEVDAHVCECVCRVFDTYVSNVYVSLIKSN